MSIGSRIKEARLHKKLTQEQLASNIGVTKGAIANYENGVSVPKIDLMYKLFESLDVDANYLHQDEMRSSTTNEAPSLTPPEHAHIQKYRSLNSEGQRRVDGYTDDLVSSGKYNETSTIKTLPPKNEDAEIPAEPIPDKSETVKVFRAARSASHTAPQYVEMSREQLDRIKNASDVEEI